MLVLFTSEDLKIEPEHSTLERLLTPIWKISLLFISMVEALGF